MSTGKPLRVRLFVFVLLSTPWTLFLIFFFLLLYTAITLVVLALHLATRNTSPWLSRSGPLGHPKKRLGPIIPCR